MSRFTAEEINLICIYDPGNRAGTIYELRDMMRYLMPDESELKALAAGTIAKLESMTDDEYEELNKELSEKTAAAYAMDFFDEDSAYGSVPPFFLDDLDLDEEPE